MEKTPSIARSLARQLVRRLQAPALALALVAGGIGAGVYASALAQGNATPVGSVATPGDPCPDELYGPDSEPWVRGELYFGTTNKADMSEYPVEEFEAFLDNEITPRFPDGLTLLTGLGQYRSSATDTIIQERSQLLIILYPLESASQSSALLEEIRDAYETQFNQDSVLRADIAPVCTSF